MSDILWSSKCSSVSGNALNNDWALRNYQQTLVNWGEADLKATRVAATSEKPASTWNPDVNYQTQKFNRPKMYAYAIPGTSQHHFGLAVDVNNGTNVIGEPIVCEAVCIAKLEANGWFRTVRYDPHHFTFLGYRDPDKLMAKGLKQVVCKDKIVYWVPNIFGYNGIGSWACEDL